MKQKSIELHIEKLVLEGFSPGDHQGISEAVERELSRMFAEQGSPQLMEQSGEIERLKEGRSELEKGSRDDAIGAKVARAIYGGSKR